MPVKPFPLSVQPSPVFFFRIYDVVNTPRSARPKGLLSRWGAVGGGSTVKIPARRPSVVCSVSCPPFPLQYRAWKHSTAPSESS